MINNDVMLADKANNIVNLIRYMSYEVNGYMAKVVLEQNRGNEYFNKVEVDGKHLKVKFYLYSSKTQTTGMVQYGFREFATICSDKEHMIKVFDKATIKLMDAIDKSKNIRMEGEL